MVEGKIRGSFRDPAGFLFRRADTLYRKVARSFSSAYDSMVESGFAEAAMADGQLLPHEEVEPSSFDLGEDTYKVLRPEELGFISYPYEWSFSQLKDAALLTLALQRRALDHGLWLKDASAFNVQFRHGRPVFIDTLSFEPYPEGSPWIAYNQFCRHFLAPLALATYRNADFLKFQRLNIDGMPLELASHLLPFAAYFRLGLQVHIRLHSRSVSAHSGTSGGGSARRKQSNLSLNGLRGLIDSLTRSIKSLDWDPGRTEWADYYADNSYSPQAMEHKQSVVSAWLGELEPESVWDLGANTGVFSRISDGLGAFTVSIDGDIAAVENSYRHMRSAGLTSLLPLWIDLSNPSPAIGWETTERQSLIERGPADVVLALALVHHLTIGNNVPLPRVASFLARVGRAAIVEYVPPSDPQVSRLLSGRRDGVHPFGNEEFAAAFADEFEQVAKMPLQDSGRGLHLFRRR